MQKLPLFDLISEVRAILGDHKPILVGSQTIHAITEDIPEIALQSIECDFLIVGQGPDARTRVNDELGIESEFQKSHGYYADAIGLASVVLPDGWRDRLVELCDENDQVIAFCADIHDIAVSKLIAGRDKDHEFLHDVLERKLVSHEIFLERIELVKDKVENDTIPIRIQRLLIVLEARHTAHEIVEAVRSFLNSTKS